jgi:5-(carboxyamino)imidazole ribonucleotide synthase
VPAPPPVTPEVVAAAVGLAAGIAAGLELVGVMAIELFLLPDGSLVVNEIAPRVHNSGHHTLESCVTSQFEQHVRAVCGLPLGSADLLTPAAMVNVLGTGALRPARLLGVEVALADARVHLHVYGKRRVFERRKMGHVTATGEDAAEALERAARAIAALTWDDTTAEGSDAVAGSVDEAKQAAASVGQGPKEDWT